MYKTLAVMLAAAFAIAALTTTGLSVQSTDAQIVKDDHGASTLAPGEIIGPDAPGFTDDFAPGKIVPPPCVGCAKEFSPGQEGLKQGIIGPMAP